MSHTHALIVELRTDALSYRYGRRREGERSFQLARGSKKIDVGEVLDLAAQSTRALACSDLTNLQRLGELLYNRTIPGEVATYLSSQPASSDLVVDLDPEISWIPWELLFDGAAFLCRRFRISRFLMKSGEELEVALRRDVLTGPGRVLVLRGDVSGLASEHELERIQRVLLPAVGEDNFVIRSAENKDEAIGLLTEGYDICHFIGHGEFSKQHPEDSGWKFPKGKVLTCFELEQITSPGAIFPRLIVANSCDSARSGDTGSEAYVSALYHSFLSRGVQHYIGTIGRVPDDVSQVFSQSFYEAFASGRSIGEALFAAREVTSTGIGWAFYVHYGDPGFSLAASTGSQPSPQAPSVIPTSGPPALEVIIAQRRRPDTVRVRRYDKLRLVRSRIQRFAQGYSDAVLFGGEAGVGKSVFLTDILDEVRSTVPNVLCGIASCKRSNLNRDYVPFKELLQSLLAPGGTPATINDRVLRGILQSPQLFYLCRPDLLFAGDWPDMSRRAANRAPVPVIAAIDHEHLLRELKAFVADLSRARPVVIVVEDLQWADASSLDLLFSTVSVGVRESPVLTIGTGRSDNLPGPLTLRLDEANRRGAESFSLDFDTNTTDWSFKKFTGHRNAEAFVVRYLKKILPISSVCERPGIHLVQSLIDYTAGNAFLLSEVVKVLRARGEIFRIPGVLYQIWEFRVGKETLIQGPVGSWLTERIDELDDGLATILKYASIEGQKFNLDLLSKVLGRNPDDVLQSLKKLERKHKLIQPSWSSADIRKRMSRGMEPSEEEKRQMFRFRHTLLVWYVRSLLTSAEEKRLHRLAGEYLEELYKNPPRGDPDEGTVSADELAEHFTKAEDYNKALRYSLNAAQHCSRGLRVTEAIRLHQKTLELSKVWYPKAWHPIFPKWIEAELAKFMPYEWQDYSSNRHYGGMMTISNEEKYRAAFHKLYKVRDKLWDLGAEAEKDWDSIFSLESRTKIS